jgi:hypothetical protein
VIVPGNAALRDQHFHPGNETRRELAKNHSSVQHHSLAAQQESGSAATLVGRRILARSCTSSRITPERALLHRALHSIRIGRIFGPQARARARLRICSRAKEVMQVIGRILLLLVHYTG